MKLGMPYMGNKRKLAKRIVAKIRRDNPKAEHFYDLFGGGGAISFEALKHFKYVHYNELNTGVVALLKDIIANGVTPKYYQWIDKGTFQKHKNDDDLFGGLCKVVWSFGNNQRDYLFAKEIEEDKRLLHFIVVDKCEKSLKEFNIKFGLDISLESNSLFDETINQRRLRIMAIVKKRVGRIDLEQLERLEQLQQLQQLERLQITNLSYDKVEIEDNSVIYLDPPYKNTTKYQHGIDESVLKEWITKHKNVYVSSYDFNLPCIMEFEHRSTIGKSKKVIEKLFTNKGVTSE